MRPLPLPHQKVRQPADAVNQTRNTVRRHLDSSHHLSNRYNRTPSILPRATPIGSPKADLRQRGYHLASGMKGGEMAQFELKNDKYRRARGGTAKLLRLKCAKCETDLMIYQKDGPGNLLRCYLNRIFSPPELKGLQDDENIREPRDLLNLICSSCQEKIGHPIRYRDGRLAFSLIHGSVAKHNL